MTQLDKNLKLGEQLGIMTIIAVFIVYPGWANAVLSIFTCYVIDTGEGAYAQYQQATWSWGFWVRDMNQQCYNGDHWTIYVPLGIVCFLLLCVAPPLVSFWLLWRHRKELDRPHVQQRYGFLYSRYRPRFWWWETVLLFQELTLVAVEVFGRSLSHVSHQVLLMLATFICLGVVNMTCAPVTSHAITLLEFVSLAVLSLTLTLSLYFVVDTSDISPNAANLVGFIIMGINIALLVAFLVLILHKSLEKLQRKAGKMGLSLRSLKAKLWPVCTRTSKCAAPPLPLQQGGKQQEAPATDGAVGLVIDP
ncbi:hypothetical protein HXX76_014935 [Chlamydomonas incerta]|uniref:TRP C-terminal domain-containing protein n=1 Tax=Chlamydomonas incerta TaxID=51695 RepID=A0A835VSK4_CHLIN|nr:hypothetical protein HXX76_014935 [Chlamydomonas incerta]|eukprot:KAG2423881.1 hypothetical protein HXX76_014935 [Chlamydomonas incerta]